MPKRKDFKINLDYMRVKDISLITMSLALFFVKKGDENL